MTYWLTTSLLLSTLFWDTITVYYDEPNSLSRPICHHNLRKSSFKSLNWAYPRHWMILSCFMIFSQFCASANHPAQHCIQSLHSTITRCNKLQHLIDLNPTMLLDYNKWRLDEVKHLHSGKNSIDTSIVQPL